MKARALSIVASFLLASCSEQRAHTVAAEQTEPAGQTAAERPQDTSQLQDSGTSSGPHMLGPLSPQTAGLPPDYAVIRLDPNAPELEVCTPRDTSKDPKREPGPIGANGALTFFGLPIAVTPEDLRAGSVEVALLGAAIDMGVG
jgi:hypothetical protein